MRYDKKEYTDYLFLREKLAGVKFQIDLWNQYWGSYILYWYRSNGR